MEGNADRPALFLSTVRKELKLTILKPQEAWKTQVTGNCIFS